MLSRADIVRRLRGEAQALQTLLDASAASQMFKILPPLLNQAADHIESLRREVRTQRGEIGQLRHERNMLLEFDLPPNHGARLDDDCGA